MFYENETLVIDLELNWGEKEKTKITSTPFELQNCNHLLSL
jgi:hypothetical protein